MSRSPTKYIVIAKRLVDYLFSIKDNKMRTYILANRLKRIEAEDIVEIFNIIYEKSYQKFPKYQEVFLSIIDIPIITEIVGLSKMSDIYSI